MTGTPAAPFQAAQAALAQGQGAAAEATLLGLLAAVPRHAAALQLLGHARVQQANFSGAAEAYHQAEACETDPALARYHLGLLAMLAQPHATDWTGWEQRLATPALRHPRLALPRWQGAAQPGGHLLVLGEQGHGDVLHFLRYLPLARQRFAGRVTLGVAPAMQTLLAPFCAAHGVHLHQGDQLMQQGFACHAFIGSLPALLGLPVVPPTPASAYLAADAAATAMWRRRRPRRQRCIGLVWEGRASHPQDALRSVPPTLLDGLRALPNTTIVGLQRPPVGRPAPEDLLDLDWGPDIADFATAAAMLAALDLVLTVDTAMAHLAGALGVPALLLLPWVPDWRWGLRGEACAWYASLTLLRQPAAGDWASSISAALGRLG